MANTPTNFCGNLTIFQHTPKPALYLNMLIEMKDNNLSEYTIACATISESDHIGNGRANRNGKGEAWLRLRGQSELF